MLEKHKFKYGAKWFEFYLVRKNVKNVSLHIRSDMSLIVIANNNVPLEFIYHFIIGKGTGITKPKHEKNSRHKLEAVKYLGKNYKLIVKKAELLEEVKYVRGCIHMYMKDPSNVSHMKQLLADWYESRARAIFQESLEKMYVLVQNYGVEKPDIEMRLMKSCLCSSIVEANTIVLNSKLIEVSRRNIDFIVLCELIKLYNKERLAEMLDLLMPDWKTRRLMLEKEIGDI